MFNNRIIILAIGAVVLMVLLYLVVLMISEQEKDLSVPDTFEEDSRVTEQHVPTDVSIGITTEWEQLSLKQLKDSIDLVENQEKKANFAHYLSNHYISDDQIDSAAYFEGLAAESFPNEGNFLIAGTEYFKAFGIAEDQASAKYLSKMSAKYLTKVLDFSPDHEGAKTMLAILAIATDDPQTGVTLLREVLRKNPDNADALYNLGVVALQAGDFATASQQFESIVVLDSTQVRAYFYLALSDKELGKLDEAKAMFENVKELDNSPEVQADVDAYLDEIK